MSFAALDPAPYTLPEQLRKRLVSPALVVFMDAVRHNVRAMLAHLAAAGSGPERWRPHVKTTKLPAVWDELLAAGLAHFKCATAREARHLLETAAARGPAGVDVLLAHPRLGPELELLAGLARSHPAARLSVLCEDAGLLSEVPEVLSVFVDVNPGMHRTGIPAGERERILAVARAAPERFRGVHFYDGHLHTGGPDQRRAEAHACYGELMRLLAALEAERVAVREVVTSGTPTFLQALAYRPLAERRGLAHRVSPGTVVFHDQRSEEENEGLDLRPAALVFARVVSHPTAELVTCDAGSKSLAAEAGDPVAAVLGRPDLVALTPSEEHLPLRVQAGSAPDRGSELLLIPRHVCPTVNLAEEVVLVEPGGRWTTAPVVARAHDLLAPPA